MGMCNRLEVPMTDEQDMTQEELMRRWEEGKPANVRHQPPQVRNLSNTQIRIQFARSAMKVGTTSASDQERVRRDLEPMSA